MDKSSTFVIRFDGASVAEANRYAEDLRDTIFREIPEADVERTRDDDATQDFGATLIVVLGTPAVVALAHGIHSWLVRNNAASIRIERPNGTLVAKNLNSADAAAIVKAFEERT
jgi:hypothetical protein